MKLSSKPASHLVSGASPNVQEKASVRPLVVSASLSSVSSPPASFALNTNPDGATNSTM